MCTKAVMMVVYMAVILAVKGEDVLSMSHEIKARIEPPERTPLPQLPVITSRPIRLQMLIGDNVIFPCKVENIGSHVVTWKRGLTHILFSGSLRVDPDQSISVEDNNSLKIVSLEPKHAGTYTCHVSSSLPATLSHLLEVLVPPKIMPDPKDGNVIVKKDDSVTLKCDVSGYPLPVVTWNALKGNLPGGLPEKRGNVLTFPSIDTYHSGQYQCKADNGVGDTVTSLFRIKVFYSPEVNVKPQWVHAGWGSTVEFSCTVAADPDATVQWTRSDGTPVHQDNEHITVRTAGMSSKVKINDFTKEHFGSYICVAENPLGTSSKAVTVSGLAEPANIRSNATGEDETSYLLLWTVKSYTPIIEYMLKLRRKKEEGSNDPPSLWTEVMIPAQHEQSVLHSHIYNITGLQAAMAYEAVMLARNDYGWNFPSDTFTFYTYGGGPLLDTSEENLSEPTTLLHPTTREQESEDKFRNNSEPDSQTNAAQTYTGYTNAAQTCTILMFISFLASIIS